jgi:hypothetical protein
VTVSGKVPRSHYAEALELYREFTGEEPTTVDTVEIPGYTVGIVIGECDGVLYSTVRDGEAEQYIHRFTKRARPLLCVTHDGKSLFLVGGDYEFRDTGINDL